jgi:hypothetical protein
MRKPGTTALGSGQFESTNQIKIGDVSISEQANNLTGNGTAAERSMSASVKAQAA